MLEKVYICKEYFKNRKMTNQRLVEIFFVQLIAYFGMWLYSSYFGFLVSFILGCIGVAILLFSSISEWIEPSRVPRWYFKAIGTAILAPLSSYLIYIAIFGRAMAWMK
jgi:hypothetical protein